MTTKQNIIITKNEPICIKEVNENLRRVELGMELTRPLKQLNTNCFFRQKYEEWCNIREGLEPDFDIRKLEVKEKNKAYRKAYYQRPENKEKKKAYQKVYHKAYYQRPEVKEKKKAYRQRPENKEKRKAYHKAYYQRPEVKEKKKAYHKSYYQRPEVKEKKKAYHKAYYQRMKRSNKTK